MTAASERQSSAPDHWRLIGDRLQTALVTPIRAMRLRYLPLLMIYYAYGALGLVTIAEAFWIKEALTLTPAELAAIGALPWTIKMVFGQLVDSVPILSSERRRDRRGAARHGRRRHDHGGRRKARARHASLDHQR